MKLLSVACLMALATVARCKPVQELEDGVSDPVEQLLYAIFSVIESDTAKQILWMIGRSEADFDRMCRTVNEMDPDAFTDLRQDEHTILQNLCQQPPSYAKLYHKYLKEMNEPDMF